MCRLDVQLHHTHQLHHAQHKQLQQIILVRCGVCQGLVLIQIAV
jgi:hypothetical protein